jgi:hypothetical protein
MLSISNVESPRKSSVASRLLASAASHYRSLTINQEMCSSTFRAVHGRPPSGDIGTAREPSTPPAVGRTDTRLEQVDRLDRYPANGRELEKFK